MVFTTFTQHDNNSDDNWHQFSMFHYFSIEINLQLIFIF